MFLHNINGFRHSCFDVKYFDVFTKFKHSLRRKSMKIETTKQNKQGGFTLVELAIVMIIIGLLIGGILKGQELIANSQVTATIAQVKGYDAAMSTFRDKYGAIPGDMDDARTRLPNCVAADNCNNTGDRNSRINGEPGSAPAPANFNAESVQAWIHLSKANLISGINSASGLIVGGAFPESKVGGGFRIGYTLDGAITGISAAGATTPGHYLVLTNEVTADNAADTAYRLSASQAAQIDRKIDDGRPTTGTVQADGSGCVANNDYAEGANNATCSPAIKVQG
jgi:prepilin-type N-terminal cleavage/methylation domain-containing protein